MEFTQLQDATNHIINVMILECSGLHKVGYPPSITDAHCDQGSIYSSVLNLLLDNRLPTTIYQYFRAQTRITENILSAIITE